MSSSQQNLRTPSPPARNDATRFVRRPSELPHRDDINRADLVSLLRNELRQLWHNGQPIQVEHFRPQLELVNATSDDWLGLITAEIQLRCEFGQQPQLDEYLHRFPALTPKLPATFRDALRGLENAPTQVEAGSKWDAPSQNGHAFHTPRQRVDSAVMEVDDLNLRIPGYDVLSILGRGGMGVVYQARQRGLNRVVALKMILAGCHADKEDRARFLQEAEAVAALRHPNIVQVYEIGEHEGKPFFSMEFVAGGTLATHIKGQPQPPTFTVDLTEQLALAVHSAHEQNIIHRDLKPANILISDANSRPLDTDETRKQLPETLGVRQTRTVVPKITDFGLAKRLDADMQLTTSGLVAGTPQYMAPEQVSLARNAIVGPATDIWSLGVILYEMLTGRPPFLGSNPAEIMHQVLRQEPVSIHSLQPKVSRDLETICLKCLEKEPHKRYPSAEALAADLARFREGNPILARPVGTLEQIWRWRKRNPTVAALGALVAIVLIGGALVASFFAFAARQEARRAEHHAQEADRLGEQARQAADDLRIEKRTVVDAHGKLTETFQELSRTHDAVAAARKEEERLKREAEQREKLRERELYNAQMNLAQRAWEIGQVPRTRRLLAAYEPLHHDRDDLRGFEWYYLDRISNAEGLRFTIPEGCRSVAMSPDGTRIAWAFRSVCEVWNLQQAPQRVAVLGANPPDRHQGIVERVAYDPTGKYIATASHDRTVKLWEAENGKLVRTLSTGNGTPIGLHFSADGKRIAATAGNERFAWQPGESLVWDCANGELKYRRGEHQGIAYDVAWSPDNDCYATAGYDQCVKIWDARDAKLLRTLTLPQGGAVRSVAFAPQGKLLAAGTSRGEVIVWSRDDWKEQRILRGHLNWVHTVAFAPNGRWLATGGSDMLLKIWDAGNGQEIRTFRGHSSSIVDAAWHPKQALVVSASMDQSIRGWYPNDDPEQFSIRSGNGNLAGFHLLPDSVHVAVVGQRAFAGIWDVTRAVTTRTTNVRSGPLGYIWDSCLAPDGRSMVYSRCAENDDTMGAVFGWDFGNPDPRDLELPCLYPGVRGVAYSLDGKTLATGHRDGTVQIHDLSGERPPRTWVAHAASVNQILTVPGEPRKLITIAADRMPRLWNWETGDEIGRFIGHDRSVRAAAISKDGRLLATGSEDRIACVWDVASGKCLFKLDGHISAVTCMSFNPEADRLVTGSDDFTLKLWDLKTGHETLTLRGHTMGLVKVAFGPGGRRIFSTAQDETLRVWNAAGVSERERLRAAAAACRLTKGALEGNLESGQQATASIELANVSGRQWPVPPPRKTNVPWRTVIRVWAEPFAANSNNGSERRLIGLHETLPTTQIANDYRYEARFPVSLQGLAAGRYRLQFDHGWIGDEIMPISEKVIEVEIAPNSKRINVKNAGP